MERLLKPVFYRIIANEKEFTKVIKVYSTPRKSSILTLEQNDLVVIEDRQDLNMYLRQDYKRDKAPESITAIPRNPADAEKIQQLLRSMIGWEENDATFSIESKNTIPQLSYVHLLIPSIFIISLICLIISGIWVWSILTLLSVLWAISVRKSIVPFFKSLL